MPWLRSYLYFNRIFNRYLLIMFTGFHDLDLIHTFAESLNKYYLMMVTRFRDSDLIHTSAEGLNIYYLIMFTSSHQWKINECCLTPVLRTINTLRPKQNVRHFADDIFRCILFNKNGSVSIKIQLTLIPNGIIDNTSALVQVMGWHWTGDKPLPEPMMTQFSDPYMRHPASMS